MVDFKKYAKQRLLEAEDPTDNPHVDSFKRAYDEEGEAGGGIMGLLQHFSEALDKEMVDFRNKLTELGDRASHVVGKVGNYKWKYGQEMLGAKTRAELASRRKSYNDPMFTQTDTSSKTFDKAARLYNNPNLKKP